MSSGNINISKTAIKGKCDLKCSFNFKYPQTTLVATNNKIYISFKCEQSSSSPVLWNGAKYNVDNFQLMAPSIHFYDNKKTQGELIIYHNPILGGKQLAVSIPLKVSGDATTASNLITQLIDSVATNAPNEGNTTNLNISGFTLQSIIPKKPFYTYSDTTYDWVVFGMFDAIPLTSSTLTKLQNIVSENAVLTPGGELFINPKGPSSGIAIGSGIYISCQPTSSTQEETPVSYDKNTASEFNIDDLKNNKYIKLAIFIFLFIIIILIAFYLPVLFDKFLQSYKSTFIRKKTT